MTQSRVFAELQHRHAGALDAGSLTLPRATRSPAPPPFLRSLGAATACSATVNVTVFRPCSWCSCRTASGDERHRGLNVDVTAATPKTSSKMGNWVTWKAKTRCHEDEWFVRQQNATNRVMQAPTRAREGAHLGHPPPIAVGAIPSPSPGRTSSRSRTRRPSSTAAVEISTDGGRPSPRCLARRSRPPTAVRWSRPPPTRSARRPGGTSAATNARDGDRDPGTMYANRTVWLRFVIGSDDSGQRGGPSTTCTSPRDDAAVHPVVGHRGSALNHVPTVSGIEQPERRRG